MLKTLRTTWLSLQKTGLARTSQRVIQRSVPDWLFDVNSLLAIEVDFADCRYPPVAEEWPHRWADESDEELLTQGGLSTERVRALFAGGGRAALCAKDGTLVAYSWYIPVRMMASGWIQVNLDRRMYVMAAYVAPEFRGLRLQTENRKFAFPELATDGYVGIIAFIEQLNTSALRSGRREPRRYIGRLSYIRLLGLVVYHFNRSWGAGFWNKTRPFEMSFDDFDRETFRVKSKHARSAFDPD